MHKKGKDPLVRDCYRGITITPTLSKILEHIVLNRVIDGLTQNPLQFGSPKGAKVYPASRRRSNKRVGLKGQLAPYCVP